MSDDLDQIRTRQDSFDLRLATLEQTVETQSTLRASMDQDPADIKALQRAQHGMLQALGSTLSDHTRQLRSIEGLLSNHTSQLISIHGRLANVEDRLGTHTRQLISMGSRLGSVEEKLGNVEGRLGGVEAELGEVKAGVHAIIAMLEPKDE